MTIHLRLATLDDVAFLTDVVITATLAQGRFRPDTNLDDFRAGYEEWTRETVLGAIPNCTLSVVERDNERIGRLRVVRKQTSITLAGIQLLPPYQNQGIGTTLIGQLKREADQQNIPLHIAVEKDNPHAQRLYERLGCQQIGEEGNEYLLAYYPVNKS